MKRCKECDKPLPNGNSLISQTARKLGYCRYCYRMDVSDVPDRHKRASLPDETISASEGFRGAEVFDPTSPWDWYEYFFSRLVS